MLARGLTGWWWEWDRAGVEETTEEKEREKGKENRETQSPPSIGGEQGRNERAREGGSQSCGD